MKDVDNPVAESFPTTKARTHVAKALSTPRVELAEPVAEHMLLTTGYTCVAMVSFGPDLDAGKTCLAVERCPSTPALSGVTGAGSATGLDILIDYRHRVCNGRTCR